MNFTNRKYWALMALRCGLQNLGYTCFVNAVLQATLPSIITLLDLHNGGCKFKTFILQVIYLAICSSDFCVVCLLQRLVDECIKSALPVAPLELYENLISQ